jgi:site-specific DNA-cytosine methylase
MRSWDRSWAKEKTPTAAGLFSGAGGLDIGLQAAGFRIAPAVERDAICCQTLRTNHRWKVAEEDLEPPQLAACRLDKKV